MEGDSKESVENDDVVDETSKERNENCNNDIKDNAESSSHDNNNDENSNGINSNNDYNRAAPPPVVGPPPHWSTVQYPSMVMPVHHPYYPPLHYVPYTRYHHAPPAPQSPENGRGGSPSNNGANRTIWVGDLSAWMDEDYLRSCFASTGEVSSIKVIRNRQTKMPEGYGFVEFTSHEAAEKVLQSYPNTDMPNTTQPFRLNWAMFSNVDKRSNYNISNNNNVNNNNNISSDLSIFVGDLASDVTDSLLQETFAGKYPSVKGAKVVVDSSTGRSKGYGFVRFGDDGERSKALREMQGIYCSSRPMRVGPATPRKSQQQQYLSQGGYSNGGSPQALQSDGESANTTIFVGGLDPNVSDEDLKQPFAPYGEIVSVKIPVGKGCGFVQFANRKDAEEALQQLSGTTIGRKSVRLAWGRNPVNRQSNNENGHQWTPQYYGGPYFDGYGYPMMHPPHPHDPYMYAGYGAYPFNGTNQQ